MFKKYWWLKTSTFICGYHFRSFHEKNHCFVSKIRGLVINIVTSTEFIHFVGLLASWLNGPRNPLKIWSPRTIAPWQQLSRRIVFTDMHMFTIYERWAYWRWQVLCLSWQHSRWQRWHKADVKARICKERAVFIQLHNILNSKDINQKTKIKLHVFKSNVKAVLLYGDETWSITVKHWQRYGSSISTDQKPSATPTCGRRHASYLPT